MPTRLHHFADSEAIADHLAGQLERLANRCIASKARFSIVLAGGTTPRLLYQRLCAISTDWARWLIYFGDERWLPLGHRERNDSMAAAAWLDHVPIPPGQVHRVPVSDSVSAAADAYSLVLERAPRFDLVILGLGEDGHTASLFPGGLEPIDESRKAIAITHAPKPPAARVSITPQRLSDADAVWFLVTGEAKRPALQAWLDGAPLPAASITPAAGVDIYTDLVLANR